ncbi:MAG: cyclic nucleotide-binding domain-containing protein [Anaerolineaceae bacterium]|nr:cyclic nucleotide-binding domain-containing protein [Anaerolineaceae bacterium]
MDQGTVSPHILQKAFPGMTEGEAREMIASGALRSFPPGMLICLEGAMDSTFYIIVDGEVEVTKVINDDEIRMLNRLKPGDFFGEMAIIDDAPRAATVTAIEPTTTLEIDKEAFTKWLERSSSLSLAMVREVSRRLRENDEMAIEDLRQKAQELADAYEKLAEQEKARSQFLTTIAHELRTPLMAANGFMQIIQTGSLHGQGLRTALDTVARNMQEIISLTNDILFLQEMDLILPEFEPTDIGSMVASAVEQQRSIADENFVGLNLFIAPGLPTVSADPKSLERAFTAILDNAFKFSPEGGNTIVEVKHGGS